MSLRKEEPYSQKYQQEWRLKFENLKPLAAIDMTQCLYLWILTPSNCCDILDNMNAAIVAISVTQRGFLSMDRVNHLGPWQPQLLELLDQGPGLWQFLAADSIKSWHSPGQAKAWTNVLAHPVPRCPTPPEARPFLLRLEETAAKTGGLGIRTQLWMRPAQCAALQHHASVCTYSLLRLDT